MKSLFKNRFFLIGLILFVIGSGPLILTMTAASLGLTTDPDPNPVIFGMMAMFSFWPGIILMGIGIFVNKRSAKDL